MPLTLTLALAMTGTPLAALRLATLAGLCRLVPALFLALGLFQTFLINQASLEQLLMQGIAHPDPRCTGKAVARVDARRIREQARA